MKFRVRLGVLAGNLFHHYDASLFGWVAPCLAPVLFPNKNGKEALLLIFAFLPLSYLIKPIGALFWGWIGDRFGRKPVIVATLTGMTCSTCMIGCLPLSSGAWIILALCRIFQGFFAAGEEKSSALFLLEHTAHSKRAWISALYDASGIIGIFSASLLASFFGATHWRLLFWLAAGTGLLAIFLRKTAKESPEHCPSKFSWNIFWQERMALTQIAIVSGFSYANYFLLSVFLNGFLPQITDLTLKETLMFNTHLLWIDFLLLLGCGLLCRWIRKEYLMALGALSAAIFAIPLFMQFPNATWIEVAIIRVTLVIFGVALAAPYYAWAIEILPKNHRLSIGGVGATIGAKLFGAPMPLLSTWLVTQTGSVWTAALPIVILGLAAGTVILKRQPQEIKAISLRNEI